MNRPFGVTLIGILSIINGVVRLFVPIAVFGVGIFSVFAGGTGALKAMGALAMLFAVVGSVVGIVLIAAGVGMFRLSSWARSFAVVVTWIALAASAIELAFAFTKGGVDWSGVLSVALSALVLWYLYRPEVTGAFES